MPTKRIKRVLVDGNLECSNCHEWKPIESFYKDHRGTSEYGVIGQCRHCLIEKRKFRRWAGYKEPYNKEKMRLKTIKIMSHPGAKQKESARHAVGIAIEKGELKKRCCEICYESDHVYAHHHDYNKPLDIIWLCQSCHKRLHNKLDLNKKVLVGGVPNEMQSTGTSDMPKEDQNYEGIENKYF